MVTRTAVAVFTSKAGEASITLALKVFSIEAKETSANVPSVILLIHSKGLLKHFHVGSRV